MVLFKNAGRLSNFMYQCFAAYSYAQKHGLEFTVPFTERDQKWHPIYFKHLRNQKYDPTLPSILVQEKTHAFHELAFQESWRNCNIVLEGYFQSPIYFNFCIDEIRRLLPFKYDTIPSKCGLHIRRGDFLLYPDKHILPPPIYYETALSYVFNYTGIRNIKIFSDDIEWCKENIKDDPNLIDTEWAFRYEYSECKTELEDFQELMNCEAIITAASTFSVLAATLSTTPSKVVVCPHESNFFGPVGAHLDLSTMYPEHFHRIKY